MENLQCAVILDCVATLVPVMILVPAMTPGAMPAGDGLANARPVAPKGRAVPKEPMRCAVAMSR